MFVQGNHQTKTKALVNFAKCAIEYEKIGNGFVVDICALGKMGYWECEMSYVGALSTYLACIVGGTWAIALTYVQRA